MAYTNNWRHGDAVTWQGERGTASTGTAIVIHRRSDGRRFVKVRITGGPGAGTEEWASPRWVIGTGPVQHDCLGCGQPYRSKDAERDFCPPCGAAYDRDPAADSGIRKPLAYMHGAGTKYTPEALAALEADRADPDRARRIAEQRARDEQEWPF